MHVRGRERTSWSEHSLHLDVDGSPPDVVFARLLEDDTLVLGTSAGLLAGEVDEGTSVGDDGALIADGVLVQGSDGSIALQVC